MERPRKQIPHKFQSSPYLGAFQFFVFWARKPRMYQSGHWSLLKIESFEDLLVPCFWWYCNSSMEFGACIPHSQQRISILTFCHVHPIKQTASRVSCKTDQQLGLSSYAELPNHTIPPIFWFSGTWHCKRKPRKSWRHLMFHLFMQLLEDLVGFLCDCQCFGSTHLGKLYIICHQTGNARNEAVQLMDKYNST